ncbi:hypothetical protein HOY80DRAFT_1134984 [Tuber brumale]|nr:hypothetical protein HOY80DRAFT_1134984 [Tuber brumale]
MSPNSHRGNPGSYVVTTTSSSSNKNTTPQQQTSSPNPSKALPDSTPANAVPPTLTCPVPSCPLVLKGEMPHGYLWRHLKSPGIYSRTGDEKDAWLHLHKIEYDGLRKREANRMRARKASRAARFKSHARNTGITEESLVAQNIAIWEGMYSAEQRADSMEYDAWLLLDFCTTP